jgi:putative ABC transport system permease protein
METLSSSSKRALLKRVITLPDNSVIDLTIYQILIAYVFVFVILIILKYRGIKREKLLIIASLRMTLQLIIVGYLLTFIFENPHPIITFGIVFIMVMFAVFTIFQKFKGDLTLTFKKVIVVSMFLGTIPILAIFIFLVIQVTPYFNPQYIIPITGMIVGNSMTGISLGIQSILKHFQVQKSEVIEMLILGASPKEASKEIVNDAFDAAILPTLYNMLGMGIVFLPGMMTGQILAGIAPTLAILYQIAVMLGILGGVALTTYFMLTLGYKTFFNKDMQLL